MSYDESYKQRDYSYFCKDMPCQRCTHDIRKHFDGVGKCQKKKCQCMKYKHKEIANG